MLSLARLARLRFGCLLDGSALPGGWVRVWLGTTAKNPFVSLHGPADDQGVVVVTGDDLLSWCTAQANFALMDYVSPSTGLNGEIAVEAVNLEAIDHALRGFDDFSAYVPYPPGYVGDLRLLAQRLRLMPAGVLDVKVLTGDETGEFRVTARPRRAVSEGPDTRT